MIPVTPQPEPLEFDANVRRPGLAFLKRVPAPKSGDFERHWRHCHQQLYAVYSGICAYSARWIPYSPGGPDRSSIDHFIPKTHCPNLAYEWDNYRLASARLNGSKANSDIVIDPFWVKNGWFVLDFATYQTKPGNSLPTYLEVRVRETIDQLDLNHNDFINQRVAIIQAYCDDLFPFTHLEDRYPFIAYELKRQALVIRIKAMVRSRI